MGERASSAAAKTMGRVIVEKLFLGLLRGYAAQPEQLQQVMEEAMQAANRAVSEQAPGGGTTLTAALIYGRQVTLAHVGDSRAYLVEDKGLMAVTRDHSLVQRMVELGQISPDEAAYHPHKNVLIRAVGQDEELEVDLSTTPLGGGSRLLLCSDGLWGLVNDAELFHLITTSPSLQTACDGMVQAANAAGGPDNIAAILIELPRSSSEGRV